MLCDGRVQRMQQLLRKLQARGSRGAQHCIAPQERSLNFRIPLRWADWSTWSDCSASCGGGSQMRSRAVAVPKDGRGVLRERVLCEKESAL